MASTSKFTPDEMIKFSWVFTETVFRETVESEGVKKALDYFSSNVKEQLMEKV